MNSVEKKRRGLKKITVTVSQVLYARIEGVKQAVRLNDGEVVTLCMAAHLPEIERRYGVEAAQGDRSSLP